MPGGAAPNRSTGSFRAIALNLLISISNRHLHESARRLWNLYTGGFSHRLQQKYALLKNRLWITTASGISFKQNSIKTRSKELVQRIVANTQTLEFVATLSTEIEYAGIAHSGCIEKAAKPGKANREQMLADFTRNDKDLTAELLMSDITAETAYLFRNLTKEELTRYASYSSEDNARQFYQNLITAVQHGLKLAGDRISLAQNTDRTKFAL